MIHEFFNGRQHTVNEGHDKVHIFVEDSGVLKFITCLFQLGALHILSKI